MKALRCRPGTENLELQRNAQASALTRRTAALSTLGQWQVWADTDEPGGSAESVNSPRLRTHAVKHIKAAIQDSGSTNRPAAPAAKVRSAQGAEFANRQGRVKPDLLPGGSHVRLKSWVRHFYPE